MSRLQPHCPRKIVVLAVLLCGCQSGAQQTALEVESRQQSVLIRKLETQARKTEQLLAQQDREIQALRAKEPGAIVTVAGNRLASTPHEVRANWGGVSKLNIHELTSGLSPTESDPYIQLVVQPLDDNLELIKVAGEIKLTASLVTTDGTSQQVASQKLSITESRKAWTRGLVSSGFHVQLPLDSQAWNAVRHENQTVLVTATLSLGSDRVYKATQLFGTAK